MSVVLGQFAERLLTPEQQRKTRHSPTAASGQSTKSLRSSSLREGKSREIGNN
jgi:hypothetical protein